MSDTEDRTITGFIQYLEADPDREFLFQEAPVSVMNRFGLSARQQRLLLDGSIADLRSEIQRELGDTDAPIVAIKIRRK